VGQGFLDDLQGAVDADLVRTDRGLLGLGDQHPAGLVEGDRERTAPAESLTTARRAGRPSRVIGKTSTVLADLVVTTSSRPPGGNATCPGERLNSGTFLLSSPRER
jgi:hypothetical protein